MKRKICLLGVCILALTGCGIVEETETIAEYYHLEQTKVVEKHLKELDLDTLEYVGCLSGYEYVDITVRDLAQQSSIIRIYIDEGPCERRLLPLLTEEERGELEEAFRQWRGKPGDSESKWGNLYIQKYAEIAKKYDYVLYPRDVYREE